MGKYTAIHAIQDDGVPHTTHQEQFSACQCLTKFLLGTSIVALLGSTTAVVYLVSEGASTLKALLAVQQETTNLLHTSHGLQMYQLDATYKQMQLRQPALDASNWPLSLPKHERRISSQAGQDGVLEYIFENIGTTNQFYLEFGFNKPLLLGGSGPNIGQLVAKGWHGLLLDGSNQNPAINLQKEWIGPHNFISLLRKYGVPKELDYMSIDFDSYDLWVFREVVTNSLWRPRVVSVEYKPSYPIDSTLTLKWPEKDGFCTPCSATYVHGTSLGALDMVAKEGGYTLVHVVQGLDAFFVRSDLLKQHSVNNWREQPYGELVDEPANCGQPNSPYWICKKPGPHTKPPTNKTLFGAFEDYAVYAQTGDHNAARKAALKSAWVQQRIKEM